MHFDETVLGGDFLADQPPVLEMCNWAPQIIDLLDRMGVPFNRTPEGQRRPAPVRRLALQAHVLRRRDDRAAAALRPRRADPPLGSRGPRQQVRVLGIPLAGASTTAQCVGIVAQDMRTMQIRAFRADAVVMATGGNGLIFGKSTMSVICTGGAASRCYQAGAKYGNPEMIQVHPTAIPGEDKCRLISESARGEGGRVWVPRKPGDTRRPTPFPKASATTSSKSATPSTATSSRATSPPARSSRSARRASASAAGTWSTSTCATRCRSIGREAILGKLEGILEIYEKFVGTDPLDEPMKIFPAVHYSMGGLWAGFTKDEKTGGLKIGDPNNMMTNIPGLYAMGEVSFAYHGANRLGANSLLSCIFDGLFGGTCIKNYITDAAQDRRRRRAADRSRRRRQAGDRQAELARQQHTATRTPTCSGRRWASG